MIVEIVPEPQGRPCSSFTAYVGETHPCRRRGRILIDGFAYCREHAGCVLLDAAIERGYC